MHKLNIFKTYGWLIPTLMIFSLPVSGGPRPMFWVSVFVGIGLIIYFGRLTSSSSSRRLILIWSLIALPVLCSLPGSLDPIGTAKVLAVLACALPAGMCWLVALSDTKARRVFNSALLLIVVFWCFDGLLQALFARDLFGVPLSDDGRVVGPFSGNLRFPVVLSLLLGTVVCSLASAERVKLALSLWMIGSAVVLMGGTRAQMVTLVVGMVLLLPVLSPLNRKFLVVLFSVLAVTWATTRLLAGNEAYSVPDFSDARWFEILDAWSSSRISSWRAASAMGFDSFWGVGASAFTEAYPLFTVPGDPRIGLGGTGSEINHAHHVWFAIFAEVGIVGVFGLVATVVLAIRWWRVAAPDARIVARPYALAVSAYLFPLALHPPLFIFWIFPVIWLLVCAYLAALSEDIPGDIKK